MSTFTKTISIFCLVIVLAFAVVMPAFAQGENPPAKSTFDWSAIYPALQNLLILLLTGATAAGARWLNAKYHLERGRLSEHQIFMLDVFIGTVIHAAEQLKLNDVIDSKLDYATAMVQNWCFDHNVKLDISEIRARIESAVHQEFPKAPPLPEG